MMQSKKEIRLGKQKLNYQKCLMEIIEYNDANDIIVEFQDKYKVRVHAAYREFKNGNIKNPYYPSVFGVGMLGVKYITKVNGENTKEYLIWRKILGRCYDEKTKGKRPTYQDVTCCNDWLLYENFYDWLHKQSNYDKWLNGERWAIDKDILVKGNQIYSPETCCLVPNNVNGLFIKQDRKRGTLPIGVIKKGSKFQVYCQNPFTNKKECLGTFDAPEEAFQAYKKHKEEIIKQVAQFEYAQGNITKECYEAMLKYEVEITD